MEVSNTTDLFIKSQSNNPYLERIIVDFNNKNIYTYINSWFFVKKASNCVAHNDVPLIKS